MNDIKRKNLLMQRKLDEFNSLTPEEQATFPPVIFSEAFDALVERFSLSPIKNQYFSRFQGREAAPASSLAGCGSAARNRSCDFSPTEEVAHGIS